MRCRQALAEKTLIVTGKWRARSNPNVNKREGKDRIGMKRAYLTATFDKEVLREMCTLFEVVTGGWGYTGRRLSSNELAKWAHDAEILIVGYEPVDKHVIDQLTNLRIVACARGGVEANVDLQQASLRGIPVIYTPGRNADAVADLAFGLLLCEVRNIARTSNLILSRNWAEVSWDIAGNTPTKKFSGSELCGKKIGIIGYGAVGQKVGRRSVGFEMEVRVFDPYWKAEGSRTDPVVSVDLPTLLRESDFVIVCAKLTPETRHLISEEQLRLMKPTSYLINVSRGAIIDQTALAAALRERRIAGAGLDVLEVEPIDHDDPLLFLSNLTVTPHIGGASNDIVTRQSKMIFEDLQRWSEGLSPRNVAKVPENKG